MPAFTVFQTPPEATATKYFDRSAGSTAKAITRPEVTAGPIERNLRPENTPAPIGSGVGVGVAAGVAVADALAAGEPAGDAAGVGVASAGAGRGGL